MAAIWGDDPSEIAVLEQSPEAGHHHNEIDHRDSSKQKEHSEILEKI